MTTSILFRWWRSEEVEGAKFRGKRVSKRRSKTSLTPGIFILCIYIYIPRPRWCREQDYLERPWELILSLSYATPSPPPSKPRSTSSFTPYVSSRPSSALPFSKFSINRGLPPWRFPPPTEKTATLSRLLFYRAKANGIIEISARTMPLNTFVPSIYIYIPRRYTSKYPDNCLRMKLNPPSLPFPAMSRRGARRNRFFLSSSFFSRRGWSRM